VRRKPGRKRGPTRRTVAAANSRSNRGPSWKHARVSVLSAESKALYDRYLQQIANADEVAQILKATVTDEWNAKFPKGLNGKVRAFRVANGDLTYVMKKKPKLRKPVKTAQAAKEPIALFGYEDGTTRALYKDGTEVDVSETVRSDEPKSAVDRMVEGLAEELGDDPGASVEGAPGKHTFSFGPSRRQK
jgi:hypothetical protein